MLFRSLIHSAQSFINAEDAIIAKKKKKGERLKNGYIQHLEQGPRPKKAKIGKKRDRNGKKVGHLQDDTPTILL